jgi:hypothetical protein
MPATVTTRKGREVFTGRMIGATPTQSEPKNLCWGLNAAGVDTYTAANSDVGLFQESAEARVVGTSSQVTTTTVDDTYQVTGTMTASAARSICEAALADSATTSPATTVSTAIAATTTTSLVVASATGFPSSGNYSVQTETEVMLVTGGQGTTTWTVTRGSNGSTALASIASGVTVTGGNAPGSTAITGGTLLTHADFAVISLNSGDSVAFTWKISVS